MKKVFVILLTLSAISIVLSGCGKKEDEAAPTTTSTDKAPDTTKTP